MCTFMIVVKLSLDLIALSAGLKVHNQYIAFIYLFIYLFIF